MWSDNETPIDFLGFQHLVSAVTCVVRNEQLLPATIGVFGDWGSGKSSLLEMTKTELSKDDGALVLSFNGWLFEGYEDAKSALMGTILDEIRDNRTLGPKAKEIAERLFTRVNWFRVLGTTAKYGLAFSLAGPVGLGIAAASDLPNLKAEGAVKAREFDLDSLKAFANEGVGEELRRAVREFRGDFKDLLAETKISRLVVVIDDLDRCLPDTVIETLEAIKLFLFVPRTVFILGADERLIEYAVRRRFPEIPGTRAEVGRDYLEKLVQFPIRVPQLGPPEIETYINVLFAKTAGLSGDDFEKARQCAISCDQSSLSSVRFNHGIAQSILGAVQPELAENLALAQRIAPILAQGLNGNPRQCKRFLNTLMLRLTMAASRGVTLKQRVLAKLMLLEYFRPEAFRTLSILQAEQEGRARELTFMEDAARPAAALPQERFENPPEERPERRGSTKRPARKDGVPRRAKLDLEVEDSPDNESMAANLYVQTCLSDPWILTWLQGEPSLSTEDLRPYFYFSRDKLSVFGGTAQRMSPIAQQLMAELFSESDAIRLRALERAAEVSPADAAAVFESIAERVRTDEDPGAENSPTMRVFEWVDSRRELFAQLIALLNDLPDSRLTPRFAPKILRLAKNETEAALAKELLQKWSQSATNAELRNAARGALKPKR
jgi:hypothetical protein